jgi:radical SAM superfamily enzyme YgiQ (UPF0313 family)
MKVLLTTLNAKYIHTNLAIRLLYELNQKHEGLNWKEFTIKENQDEVAENCKNYDVVAFSCYIWNITQTIQVAEKIKELNPKVQILLGGPEVSYEYEDIIKLNCIDFIIVGEGEMPFAQFLENFPHVQNIQGLVFKSKSEIFTNPCPSVFDVLKYERSMPYQFDKTEELKNKVLYIETSRGCPYKCEFCLASLDNKVRYLPMSTIKNTLSFLMQHGKVIKFLDRTFNVKRDFTLEIFQFILDHHQPYNVFQFEITADILHPDIVKFIHEKVPKGLFRFEIGIQTVNQKANLEVSRKQNFEKTKKIIQDLDYKIEMHLDLIVGLPLDYWEDIKYSFEEVFKLFAPEMQLGFLKFLKGTTMRNKPQHGFKFDPNPPYQLIESNYLSQLELKKITQLEHALEIYWNSGKATNTLKYVASTYSIFDFLLELGIYFGTKKPYHQYALNDVFEIATQFAINKYPEDIILKQMIGIDYYLHFKVKPQVLFLEELPKSQKNNLIQLNKLNHHQFRFAMFLIDFDFNTFKKSNQIVKSGSILIIQYDGLKKAKVLSEQHLVRVLN